MAQKNEFDVGIIGCGPVGALLGNLLGKCGLSVVILEREVEPYPLPRAVSFDDEVMRIFQRAGLADAIAKIARATFTGTKFVSATGQTLLVRRGVEGSDPNGRPANWTFHQPFLEHELRRGLERFPSIKLLLRHDVFAVDVQDCGAVIRAEDMSCGVIQTFHTKYVIGCDGARSLVRRLMGSAMEDFGFHQPWMVFDLLVDPASPRVGNLPEHSLQFCDPQRPTTLVNVGGNRRRWEIMLMPSDDPTRLAQADYIWPLLSRWIGPEDARIERSAVYTFHSLIATGWRRGSLLLAGDSCHQTPPFLGQGMCAGMRDAANLAWKLAMVVKGLADPALLDTYESERRPHVDAFIKLAVKLGSIIQTTDPVVAAERDSQLGDRPDEFDYPRPQLGPGVCNQAPPPTGTTFSPPSSNDGRMLDAVVGEHFAVIGEKSLIDAVDDAAREVWEKIDAVVISAVRPELAAVLSNMGAAAIILRPDSYVFGIARDPAELSLLSRNLASCLRLTSERRYKDQTSNLRPEISSRPSGGETSILQEQVP